MSIGEAAVIGFCATMATWGIALIARGIRMDSPNWTLLGAIDIGLAVFIALGVPR